MLARLVDGEEPAETLSDDEPPVALPVAGDEPDGAEPLDVEPAAAGVDGDEPDGDEPDGDEADGDEPDGEEPAGGGVEQAARTRTAPATRAGIVVVSRRDIESLLDDGEMTLRSDAMRYCCEVPL